MIQQEKIEPHAWALTLLACAQQVPAEARTVLCEFHVLTRPLLEAVSLEVVYWSHAGELRRVPSFCMLGHKAEELHCPEHSLPPGLCSQHEAPPTCQEAIGPAVSPNHLMEEGLLVGAHSWSWAGICLFLSAATHI